ncbi:MAG: hypothetical protein HYV09_13170 [Deltaproteobacteria bacterium]|nr:hypothetical protein [Deltaproteobacteria bacterium]
MNHVLRASALLAVVGLIAAPASAGVVPGPSPTPIYVPPTFSCSVTNVYRGDLFTTGTITIVKTGGAALSSTANVVATISIPSGKATTSTCGSSLTGTPRKVTLNGVIVPPDSTKTAIYTCTAVVSGTCSSTPPPPPPK